MINIKLKNVYLSTKHPVRDILSDINLEIVENEFVIILGSNGSGKSSLLKLIDRRYIPTSGKISLNGKAIVSYSSKSFAKLSMTLSQNPLSSLFSNLTVNENCQIALHQCKNVDNNFNIGLYLKDYNQNLTKNLNNLVSLLSGGEQQALALALACLARPRILLLDEHTSALDPHAADRLMELTFFMVKKYNITCLLTTHNLNFAQKYGSRLVALNQGKIIRDYNYIQKDKLDIEQLKKYCYC